MFISVRDTPVADVRPESLSSRRVIRTAVLAMGTGLVGVLLAVAPAGPALAATWSVVSTPNPAATANQFRGVDALSTTDAWAVGLRQEGWNTPVLPLVARWNGSAWSQVSTPAVSGDAILNGVDGNTSTNVWAVGEVGTAALTERWNGSSWSVVPATAPSGATSAGLRAVQTLTAGEAWAVGSFSAPGGPASRTLVLRWNGTAWTHVSSPSPDATQNFLVAVGGSANDLWAAGNMGHDGYGGDTVATLMLRWNGSSWSQMPLPNGSLWETGFSIRKLRDIAVVASNDVWAVGSAFSFQTFSDVPYFVHWNGQTWHEGTLPSPAIGGFSTVAALSATQVYAFGEENGQRLIARWNGSSWSRETPPSASGTLFDASATPTATLWAVGAGFTGSGSNTLAIRTTNG
jgi:hypothetical protein